MLMKAITDRLAYVNGDIGIAYIDLSTGKQLTFTNQTVFPSGGMVMLMVLVECFRAMEEGTISRDMTYRLKAEDVGDVLTQFPSSYGVIQYLHEGIELTVEDLYHLMVAVSDNVACNILIDLLGMDRINETFRQLGFEHMVIQRKIYDGEKMKAGIENLMSVEEVATIFQKLYHGELISEDASRKMLSLMEQHQKNRFIPETFRDTINVAHLTSFEKYDVIDGGIIYDPRPFVLIIAASRMNSQKSEPLIRDITKLCFRETQEP